MELGGKTITQNIANTGQVPNRIVAHNEMIYIIDSGTSDIKILDPRTDRIVSTIALEPGANPWDIEFVSTTTAYVSNWVANTVCVVDLEAGKIIKDIDVGKGPEDIMILNNQAFVTNTGYAGWGVPYEQGTVNIIDILTDTVIDTIPVPTNPQKAVLAPDDRIHILCTGDYVEQMGRVAIIDLYTGPAWNVPAVVDTIELGGSPGDLEITPAGKAYAVAWGDGVSGFLYAYDAFTSTVSHDSENPIKVGPNTGQVLYDGRENCLWIPFMSEWGGDGFVQKFDVELDSVTWVSQVVGNGTQQVAVLEQIWDVTPWADSIVNFMPGDGAGFGQNYAPDNVLGPPDQSPGLNEYTATTSPQELLSLGHNGEIVLFFDDNTIVNGPGADFTVFENVFISRFDNQPFIEAGIVSVSQDGTEFFEFPYDTSTWDGLAGITPTKNNYEFMNPRLSGGDQFDLDDLGLKWANYVKIKDLGDIKSEGAWNADFDLDAIVALNYVQTGVVTQENENVAPAHFVVLQNYPNPFNPTTTIRFTTPAHGVVSVDIFNASGQLIVPLLNQPLAAGQHAVRWNGLNRKNEPVGSGTYIARIKAGQFIKSIKMSLIR
jgi:YVTN family beta-propeller protein